MAMHTESPWVVREGPRHSPEECNLTICGDIFQLADINGPNYSHCEANARLISAAPDLLEALCDCIAAFPFSTVDDPEVNEAVAKARAAIAKAGAAR